MKTLKYFTKEIKAKIPQYIEKYTEGIFDGKRYETFKKENAEELINFNYEKCGYKKPVVLVAENPYEAQLFFNYVKANKKIFAPILYILYCINNNIKLPKELTKMKVKSSQLDSQLRSQLDSQLYSQLGSQLRSQLDSQLRSQLRSQPYSQLYSQPYSQLYSQLRSQLGSQLRSQLDSQLRSQLRSQLYSQLRSQPYSQLYSQLGSQLRSQLHSQLRSQLDSQLYSQLRSQLYSQLDSQLDSQLRSQLDSQLKTYNEDWLFTTCIHANTYFAWFKFIKDEFKIKAEINVSLDSFHDMYMKSNVYSAIFSELLCVVSKYPKKIHRNANFRLHNISRCAVEWGNSCEETKFECYYINGRNIASDKFKQATDNKVTKSLWFNEKNEDIKAAWFEILGSEKVMQILEAKKIDSNMTIHANGDMEEHELYKTPFILEEIGEPLAWIKFICPSTDSVYLISCNPKHDKVMDAVLESCPFYGKEILTDNDYSFSARG